MMPVLDRSGVTRRGVAASVPTAALLAMLADPAHPVEASSDEATFETLLPQVAEGWNTGDATLAASAFAPDAVYVEPPDRQRHVGRGALFRFFGGGERRPRRMTMAWHHIAFDTRSAVGFGEYTFALPETGFQAHGVTVVAVRDGLIASWREYQYASALTFERFAGESLRS